MYINIYIYIYILHKHKHTYCKYTHTYAPRKPSIPYISPALVLIKQSRSASLW